MHSRTALIVTLVCASFGPSVGRAQPTAPDDAVMARFAQQLVAHANADDCAALERMVDVHAMVATALAGIPLRGTERMSLEVSIARSLMTPNIGILARACAPDARVISRGRGIANGRAVARFRIQIQGGAAMFVDFALETRPDGTAIGVDIFQSSIGEWASAQIRATAVPIGNTDTAFARTLDARQRLLVQNFASMQALQRAASAGDVEQVTALVVALPEALRNDRSVLMLRVGCAQTTGNMTAYRSVLEDFIRLYPNDVSASMLALDLRLLERNLAAATEVVGRLEQLIGRDPFFDLTRGTLLAFQNRHADALALVMRAAQADPDYVEAWTIALDLGASLGRHADATRAYRELVRLVAVPPRFATDPMFARLKASPEFRAASTSSPR